MAMMACSALMWGLKRTGCKASHREGCKPIQACPVHSTRLSDVKQICQPHSRVKVPPLVRHYMGWVYFQKHGPLSNPDWVIPSSSVMERKILLLPALLHPLLSLEDRQEEKSAISMKRGMCACAQHRCNSMKALTSVCEMMTKRGKRAHWNKGSAIRN